MHIQHVDESGKGGPILVVGSLTAKADPNWLDFSVAWDTVLKTKPAIPHFHLRDQQGLSDAEHWRKIDALIGVITRHVERADVLVLHVEPYKRLFSGKIGVIYDNPLHQGYISIIQQCALELPDPDGRVDTIFDDMDDTQYLELLSAYRTFKAECPNPAVKARLGADPIRRSDEEVLPLQAADLFAGLMRRAYEEDDATALATLRKMGIPSRGMVWDEAKLQELLSRSEARAPNLGTGLFYEERKARSKRLAPDRALLKRERGKR